MIGIDLYDKIKVAITETKKIRIQLDGSYAKGVPNNQNNIVYRAVEQFFSVNSLPKSFGVDIKITKNIPHKSGLGGGSSNAASVLIILHHHCDIPLDTSRWGELGLDVPFFLGESLNANTSGYGEILEHNENQNFGKYNYGVLLLFPKLPISTPWAFGQLKYNRENNLGAHLCGRHNDNSLIRNDFQPLVFSYFYDIQKVFLGIQRYSPTLSGLSGSGSSIFAFFEHQALRDEWISKHSDSVITKSIPISHCSGVSISPEDSAII